MIIDFTTFILCHKPLFCDPSVWLFSWGTTIYAWNYFKYIPWKHLIWTITSAVFAILGSRQEVTRVIPLCKYSRKNLEASLNFICYYKYQNFALAQGQVNRYNSLVRTWIVQKKLKWLSLAKISHLLSAARTTSFWNVIMNRRTDI